MTRVTKGNNGITQKYSNTHKGIDIGYHTKESDNILLAHSDGKVIAVVNNYNKTDSTGSSYGNTIVIEHKNNYRTRHAHCKYKSIKYKVGDYVLEGDEVAIMGNTGHSKGRHDHFEVIHNGIRIDPTKYRTSDLPEQEYKTGEYKLLKSKYLRKTPEVNSVNKLKRKDLNLKFKSLTTADKLGYAKFIIGKKVEVIDFKKDKNGYTWARVKTENTHVWFCLFDRTGAQAK